MARENRRRKRHGMAPLVDTVMPSATGWGEETPSPDADSLAAQYVRKRRTSTSGPDDEDEGGDRYEL
jgi:hypothetical protein